MSHPPAQSARPRPHRRGRVLTGLALALLATTTPSARAAVTPADTSPPAQVSPVGPSRAAAATSNPLAGRAWGVYQGAADQAWPPYEASHGEKRALLAKIALRPKAKWFGAWIPDSRIESSVADYITNAQAGDPQALVQMTVFRMVPWEADACKRLPTKAERKSYKRWTDEFAAGVGDTHTAIILQADGPFALCAPHHSQAPSRLIGYSARVFSSLPNTSVYLDAGAADWPYGEAGVGQVLEFLKPAGISYARGVALNSTHYSATADEVARGAAIVQALAAQGIPDKHVVVNTSSNGQPFVFGDAEGSHPDNADVCTSKSDRTCVTLGIPPTADVTNPAWGQSAETNALAAQYVDGYLWFGRPWLFMQADPFDMKRALALARTTPYPGP